MNRVPVHSELITWARERAGPKPLDLAGRFPKLAGWESWEVQRTLRQREGFAPIFSVVIGDLFLSCRRRALRQEREEFVLRPMAAPV